MKNEFIFLTCQIGAEPAIKRELSREHPELHFAFSRPGFMTFKITAHPEYYTPGFSLHSIFSRTYGLSIGKTSLQDLEATARPLCHPDRPITIHLWERDRFPLGEEPKDFILGEWTRPIRDYLHSAAWTALDGKPEPGERVLDLIAVDPDVLWVGVHEHHHSHSAFAGGRPEIVLPAEAPSRAYLKLEEALLWSRMPLQEGDTAVEIGSAPGGAAYALLQRGLKVIGIDPAAMDPVVLKHPQFQQIQRPVVQVMRENLPDSVQWLLLDMNVEPGISLFAVDRLVSRMESSLLGVLLTIKLNQWKMADDIPSMFTHLRAMGLKRLRATQLAANKQEFCVFGLTRKGLLERKS